LKLSLERLAKQVSEYFGFIKYFSNNARMYLLASAFVALSYSIQIVLFNLYLLSLGFNEKLIGQVSAAVALGVACGGLPAGILYDRWGGKWTFRIATVGMVLSLILRSVSVHPFWLIFWAAVNGLGTSMYFVSIFPFITGNSQPRERSHLYGSNLAVWTGCGIIGSLLAGALPGTLASVFHLTTVSLEQRYSLFIAAGIAGFALLPLAKMRNADNAASTQVKRKLLPSLESRKPIGSGALVLVLTGLGVGLTTPFFNVYFKRILGANNLLIGTLFSLSQFVALLCALIIPAIVRRWGLLKAPSAAYLINAPLLLLVGLQIPFAVIAITFLLIVGMGYLGDTTLMNLIMETVPPLDRGSMAGVRLITNYGAQALAGLIGGWIIIQAGYPWLFTAAAVLELSAATMIWLNFRSRKQTLETA
jgi:MFS family permease